MSWLEAWWDGQCFTGTPLSPEPEVPATYGTALGEGTPHPWSAVAGAVNRLPKYFNLNNLRDSVLAALSKHRRPRGTSQGNSEQREEAHQQAQGAATEERGQAPAAGEAGEGEAG